MSELLKHVQLYDSSICRLCSEENSNGTFIFTNVNDEFSIGNLINRYLPINIKDDGRNSRWICPGCHIQVESTVQFFNLVIEGQKKLKLILDEEQLQTQHTAYNIFDDSQEKTVGFSNDKHATAFFDPDHAMVLQMENSLTEKPKKKRGRPRKSSAGVPDNQPKKQDDEPLKYDDKVVEPIIEEETIENEDGRRKRKIKIPIRLREAIKGKELDEIFTENPTEEFDQKDEIIGHIRNSDGSNLGELILINNNNQADIKYNKMSKQKTKFLCDICNQVFIQEQRYLTHRSKHNVSFFECQECLEQFNNRDKLLEHQSNTKHTGEGRVETLQTNELVDNTITPSLPETATDSSNKIILSPSDNKLENTDLSTKNKPSGSINKLKCGKCDKVFTHPSSLIYHNKADHNNGRRFVCSKCNKVFKHKQLLKRHQLVHTTNRPFVCTICNTSFKSKNILQNHQVIHTKEKNFECTICDKSFSHYTSLKLHLRWHNNEKPFQCQFCNKRFTQNGNLQEHIRIHNGEKPFKCPICDKAFVTSSQVKLHIRRHYNDKSFECNICNKPFLLHSVYVAHMRRHRSDKPFVCDCKKAFYDKWSLQKHQRTHTGLKPYACNVCNKQFSDISNFKKHKKLHIPKVLDVLKANAESISNVQATEVIENSLWPVVNNLADSQENEDIVYLDYINNADKLILNNIDSSTVHFDNNEPIFIAMSNDKQIADNPIFETSTIDISKVQIGEPGTSNTLLNIQNTSDANLFDINQQCVELITSDGEKIRLFANYSDVMQSTEFLPIS